ncbi:WD repeat-containing protein 82 [Aphelenchoides fujianensis]|nr:WD repeat-containing protein 82 [Aphelenchoides fujianensis]
MDEPAASTSSALPATKQAVRFSPEIVRKLQPHDLCDGLKGRLNSLAFNADGRLLLASETDSTELHLLDFSRPHAPLHFAAAPHRAAHAQFTRHGEVIYAERTDGRVKVLSLEKRQAIGSLMGHQKPVSKIALSLVDDLVITTAPDREVRVWELRAQNKVSTLRPGEPLLIARQPKGRLFATAAPDRWLKLHDVRFLERGEVARGDMAGVAAGAWTDLSFSPDGRALLVTPREGPLVVLETAFGRVLQTLEPLSTAENTAAAFSPCSQFVAAGAADGRLAFWEAASGRLLRKTAAERAPLGLLAFNPAAEVLVSGGRQLQLWGDCGCPEHAPVPLDHAAVFRRLMKLARPN